jgi:hypothetical protein
MTEPNSKSGTTIVKSAPPKETARITVKPNLPPAAVRAVGNLPVAKPVAAGVAAAGAAVVAKAVVAKAVARPANAPKPATTIVKSAATPTVVPATVKPGAASSTVPVPAMPAQFQEEGSTMLTTVLAGVLAAMSWATAGILIASYMSWI